jgi:ABC-type sugar transport system permease subunit
MAWRNRWQSFLFLHIDPCHFACRPVTLFAGLYTNTIFGALPCCSISVYATTGGGPADRSMTVVLFMYETAFKFSARRGRARSAMAIWCCLCIKSW